MTMETGGEASEEESRRPLLPPSSSPAAEHQQQYQHLGRSSSSTLRGGEGGWGHRDPTGQAARPDPPFLWPRPQPHPSATSTFSLSLPYRWLLPPSRPSFLFVTAAAMVSSPLLAVPLLLPNSPLLLSLWIRSGRWRVAISVLLQRCI